MLTFTSTRQSPGTTCHILTRNDQNTIIDSLGSVLRSGIFSHVIILLDTKTEDNTYRIIEAFSAKYPQIHIIPYNWSDPPNFAAARNRCIELTPTPYAFWLDGDEKLVKPQQLRGMLNRARGQAFQMWIISPVPGGHHNMFQPRLFPVVPGVRFECPVFERLDWSLERMGIPTEKTDADPIFHQGYSDVQVLKKKNVRNLRIMSGYLRKNKAPSPQRDHVLQQYKKLAGK